MDAGKAEADGVLGWGRSVKVASLNDAHRSVGVDAALAQIMYGAAWVGFWSRGGRSKPQRIGVHVKLVPDAQHVCDRRAVLQTNKWVQQVVVGWTLCPWAAAAIDQEALQILACPGLDQKDFDARVRQGIERIRSWHDAQENDGQVPLTDGTVQSHAPTIMLVFTEAFQSDFLAFLDYTHRAERIIRKLHCTGIVQIATFHPHYVFDGAEPDDVSNFTNRSPYPVLHLLSELDVENCVSSYPDPDKVWQRNMSLLSRMGKEAIQDALHDICE